MIYPTDRFLKLALVPVLLTFLLLPIHVTFKASPDLFGGLLKASDFLGILEYSALAILLGDGALAALFFFDGLLLPRRKRFSVERATDQIFSIGYPHHVTLNIFLKKGLLNDLVVRIHDDKNPHMTELDFPHEGRLLAGKNVISYRLQVQQRGNHALERVYITALSPLGLVRKVLRIPCLTELRVYPDLKAVSRYVLLARKSHLGLIGIRRAARAGGDNDFERLREYQRDDEFKHIDWKASARNDKLIVRTYQMSQNQTVIFLLDCGRMMTAEIEGRSMLDYALNSVLLLARVALDQGDRVGLMAFDSGVLRYTAPAHGPGHHRRLVRAGYDLFASHEESNFDMAFQHLNAVCRKRSLVCLITNVIDQMNAEMMHSYLGAIAGRHLPFAVLLQYRDVAKLLEAPPQDMETLYTQAAAADFLLWRRQVIQKLKNRGVLTLEAFPDKLDANLINEYLWIKARKLL